MSRAPDEAPARRRFARLVALPAERIDLAEGALLIACLEYPQLDVTAYRARLDEWGAIARRRLAPLEPEAALAELRRFLFEELGFRGDTQQYYDPRNSFLNDVLDRRVGIPITLSTVFLEVARRAGLPASGVGLPGHFIVRVTLPGGERLVDPFHGGALLDDEACQRRLDRVFEGRLRLRPELLAPSGPRQMLERMLQNLKAIYVRGDDHERALGVVDLLLLLSPTSLSELKDRGLIYAALDCYALAVRDLRAWLLRAADAPEAPAVREKLAVLETRARRVN